MPRARLQSGHSAQCFTQWRWKRCGQCSSFTVNESASRVSRHTAHWGAHIPMVVREVLGLYGALLGVSLLRQVYPAYVKAAELRHWAAARARPCRANAFEMAWYSEECLSAKTIEGTPLWKNAIPWTAAELPSIGTWAQNSPAGPGAD